MRNLFSTVVLACLLGMAGCASNSSQSNGNGQAATPEWQYRTFAITAGSDMEFHSKIFALNQQGWSFVSVSNTTRGAVGTVSMVLMRKQNR
jgi:hypothetical protein